MSGDFLTDTLMKTGFGGAVASFVLLYLRERQISKAKGDVATQTVGVHVDRDRLLLLENRLSLLNETFSAERATFQATISRLHEDLESEVADNARKDTQLAELRAEMDAMRERLRVLTQRIDDLLNPPSAPTES